MLIPTLTAVTFQDSLDRLNFLEGRWESHEVAKGADGKDVPFTLTGTNTWILEHRFLQIDESFAVPGDGKFANHILMTFDERAKEYRAWWYTNQSARPIEFTGKWTGEKELEWTDVAGRLRILYRPESDGKLSAELDVMRNDKWEVQTTAHYQRTSK
jgi:hypothetical protein